MLLPILEHLIPSILVDVETEAQGTYFAQLWNFPQICPKWIYVEKNTVKGRKEETMTKSHILYGAGKPL